MSLPVHPRLPRGEAFRFTPFITDECIVTEWVTPGLPRMLPVVQDDSLCTPIITWNSLTPPPPPHPKQYFPTHRLRFKTPLKHLKSQVIGQEICLMSIQMHLSSDAHCCRCNLNRKKCYRCFNNEHHNLKKF